MEDCVEPLCHRISWRSHSSTQVPVQWNGNLESRVIPFTKIMTATFQIAPRVSFEEEWLDQLLDHRSLIKPSGELCDRIVGFVVFEPRKVFGNCGSGGVHRRRRSTPVSSWLSVHIQRHLSFWFIRVGIINVNGCSLIKDIFFRFRQWRVHIFQLYIGQ